MDITGARWSVTGAEAVLKLRAVRANGDFDTYWKFHLASCSVAVTVSRGPPAATWRRAWAASRRTGPGVRPTMSATSVNPTPNRSWSTQAVRSAGLSVSSTTRGAKLTCSSSVTRSAGSAVPWTIGSGSQGPTYCSRSTLADCSRSNANRADGQRCPGAEIQDRLPVVGGDQSRPPVRHDILGVGVAAEHRVRYPDQPRPGLVVGLRKLCLSTRGHCAALLSTSRAPAKTHGPTNPVPLIAVHRIGSSFSRIPALP